MAPTLQQILAETAGDESRKRAPRASERAPGHAARRMVFIAREGYGLARGRDDLIRALTAARHQVLAIAGSFTDDDRHRLETAGARCLSVEIPGPSERLFADRRAVRLIADHLREFAPSTVVASGPRALPLGIAAASQAKVDRVIAHVSRLPAPLTQPVRGEWLLRWRWRGALAAAHMIVTHNREDGARMVAAGVLAPSATQTQRQGRFAVVPGAGVDLALHALQPLPPIDRGLVFLMMARRARENGVAEFIDAARRVKARSPATRFVLAGPAARDTAMLEADASGVVEIHGDQSDVRSLIGQCHVVVLPSLVEGLPRILQQAMAAGRPLITTNIPGSRETVDERVNGVLVPVRDAPALALAIESYLKRPDLIPFMARASRLKAERAFDVAAVNASWMEILGLIGAERPA